VPVWVFETSRWIQAHAPFTETNFWGYSQVGLRSLIPEPRHDVMWERADTEAVHEASHVFTHRYRRPQPRFWGGETRKDLWYWLDEATAVFMESQIFRGHKEPMRFAINLVYRPELSLSDEGPGGGYSAAWFVHYLAERHGPEILRETWRQAGPLDADPIEIIDRELTRQGSSFEAAFTEYCVDAASMGLFNFDVFVRHGNRLTSESFRLAVAGSTCQSSVVDWLEPLACRYYRIEWADPNIRSIQVAVKPESASALAGVNAALIPFCGDAFARPRLDLAPDSGAPGLRGRMTLSGGEVHAILVVARGIAAANQLAGFRIECSASY
jgi:hypothetical protein